MYKVGSNIKAYIPPECELIHVGASCWFTPQCEDNAFHVPTCWYLKPNSYNILCAYYFSTIDGRHITHYYHLLFVLKCIRPYILRFL